MSESIVLVREAGEGAWGDTDKTRAWVEHLGVADVDALVEQVGESLRGDENNPKPRKFEVIEVTVQRRTEIARRVETRVVVDVKEESE